MALTGSERVERHRQKQRGRIAELEAENTRLANALLKLSGGPPRIRIPTASKRRVEEFNKNLASGGYGPSLAAGNEEQSADSFIGGVTVALSMLSHGKEWYKAPTQAEDAIALMLANAVSGDPGACSQMHAAGTMAIKAYMRRHAIIS